MFENITIGQIAAFIAFVVALYTGVKYLKKELKEAITEMLEDEFKSVDEKLDKDNKRLNELEESNKVICRGILALLSHEINGNSNDKLIASQREITDYLIDR